jgi:hypothetical protein
VEAAARENYAVRRQPSVPERFKLGVALAAGVFVLLCIVAVSVFAGVPCIPICAEPADEGR